MFYLGQYMTECFKYVVDIPPVSRPLRAAFEAPLSAFFRVSLVASTGPFSLFVVEERDLEATTVSAGVVVLPTDAVASREVKGVTRVMNDMMYSSDNSK